VSSSTLDGVLTDTSEFHYQAGSNWLMKKAFLSTGNEQLRGWSRRIRYYICWVSSGLRKKAQEMMARKNGYMRNSFRVLP